MPPWGSKYQAPPSGVPAAKSSGGWGYKFVAPPTAAAPKNPLPSDSSGVSGFVKHLGSDAEQALTGIGPGVAKLATAQAKDVEAAFTGKHPPHGSYVYTDVVKPVGQSYAQTYGPLAHGDVGGFLHQLEQHPLGPILDALTVATLGAGGVAKVGNALAKAGAISDEARLANLGRAVDLTAPDYAKAAGQAGEDVTIKQSAGNPLIQGRQRLVNAGLNKLPAHTPAVGSDARVLKAISKGPAREGARVKLLAQPFEQAFAKLTPSEQAAFHLTARAVTPAEYKAFLLEGPSPSAAMLKLLDNPKVGAVAASPSPRLADALAKGRALSDHLTALKVAAGHLDELTAAEHPYMLQRLMSGAKVVPADEAAASPALVRATAERDRLAAAHNALLDREAVWVQSPKDLRGPMTSEQAQARLAELDRQHAALVQKIVPEVSPYGPQLPGTAARAEQRYRNVKAGQTGIKPTTVRQEEADLADAKLRDVVAANPDHPAAQRYGALLAERDALQAQLNQAGEASLEGGTAPTFPKFQGEQPNVPAASNPYRDAIVRLGHRLEAAQTKLARLEANPRVRAASASGVVGGKPVEQIAHELQAAGREQPFYVHDTAVMRKGLGRLFHGKPSGLAEPGLGGSAKQNLGVLSRRGMLAFNQDPISSELYRFASNTEAGLLHDELTKHAAVLPHGEPLPHGYDYLKLNRGEAAAPYTEQVGAAFEHGLNPGTADAFLTRNEADPLIATDAQGQRLIVPSGVRKTLQSRSVTYHGAAQRLLYGHPTSIWKHLVLGLRPAFFGNITVGNSILGMLQMAPGGHGLAGWLNQVVPGAERVLGPKLTAETVAEVLPEQSGRIGTFGGSMGFTPNKGLSLVHQAYQGVMPMTIAYENVLRRAMIEGWAKASPEVRAAMRTNGGDVNLALADVAKTHPQVLNNISRRVDDALGNYRTYNRFEQTIRQLIPFYGWDRHIVRSVARLALEHPARLDALLQVGAQGHAYQQQTLGDLPPYMQGDVKLPGLPGFMGPLNGRTPLLSTHSLNPFNTAADLLHLPQAITGVAGGAGSEELSSGLNPLLQALIEQRTGRSLLSGAPIKGNALANTFENIPQVALVQSLRGKRTPTKRTSLYQSDFPTMLAAFLGAPVKKTNLGTAHLYADQAKTGK